MDKPLRRKKSDVVKDKPSIASALKSIEKIDSSIERRFLIGSIVSDEFNSAIHKNNESIKLLLPSKVSKLIYGWSSNFYSKYDKAINASLGNLFLDKDELLDKDVSDDVKDVLADISKQYSKSTFNYEYELDSCREWLDGLHVSAHISECDALRELNRHKEAESKTIGFKPIEWESDSYEYDPLDDDELLKETLSGAKDPMFKVKGGFGDFISKDMVRTGFVCFMAPDKAGKSWTLDSILHDATISDKVVFKFDIGDLSRTDIQSRLITEISGTPIDDDQCGEHYSPVSDCVHNQNGSCNLPSPMSLFIEDTDGRMIKMQPEDVKGYHSCSRCRTDFDCAKRLNKKFVGTTWREKVVLGKEGEEGYKGLDFDKAKESIGKYKRRRKRKTSYFWNYPNNTFSVKNLRTELLLKRKQGIKPDVIEIDYIDLMVAENTRANKIDQIDQIWKDVRALAQEFECLVITVSQSDAGAYNNPIINRSNFSGSKLKLAHCTAMYSLQRMQADVDLGCCRYQRILSRFQEATEEQCVVLQDLRSGKLNIDSYVQSLDDLINYHPAFAQLKFEMEEKLKGNDEDRR